MKNETSPSPVGPFTNRRWLIATFVVVILLGGIILFFTDPFHWHWRQRLSGHTEPSIAAMPPHSMMVVQFDQATADLPRLAALWHTFTNATADFDPPLSTPFQTFPQLLQDLNITLAADVLPWLGQTASLSFLSFNNEPNPNEWVVAADSVDATVADAFLAKLAESWELYSGSTPTFNNYQRVAITNFPGSLAISRSANLVLVGSSETAVKQAIDAQYGDSLSQDIIYQEALATLPPDSPLTIYLPGAQIQPMAEAVWGQTPMSTTLPLPQFINSNDLRSLAFAVTTTAFGLQIDSSTLYDPTQLSAARQAALELWLVERQTDRIAPENTLAYLSHGGFNMLWQSYRNAVNANPEQADIMEAIELLGDRFGLDPNRDLFDYLDGETAVLITPSRAGSAAQLLGLNLGVTLLAETSQPDLLATNLDTLTAAISDPQLGIATVNKTAVNDIPLHQIETSLLPGISLVYGISHDTLLLSTSEATIGELNFGSGPSLADNPQFQLAQAAMPTGKQPALFINMAELIQTWRTSGIMLLRARQFERETAVLRPITLLAAWLTKI